MAKLLDDKNIECEVDVLEDPDTCVNRWNMLGMIVTTHMLWLKYISRKSVQCTENNWKWDVKNIEILLFFWWIQFFFFGEIA